MSGNGRSASAARGRPAQRTGLVARAGRLARLAAHILRGLYLLRVVYPRRARVEQLRMIRGWSRALLDILAVQLRLVEGSVTPAAPCVAVANHMSWLDAFAIDAIHPSRFVAKAEIRGWPLIGPLCAMTGTLFIERVRRRDAHRINAMMGDALADGDAIAVFPEGTTTTGEVLLHFHANLLQAAIDRGLPVQPIALRYLCADGSRCLAAANVGEQSLAASLLEILAQPEITAEIDFLPALESEGHTRRQLARLTEAAISSALGVPVVHRQPASPGDRPA